MAAVGCICSSQETGERVLKSRGVGTSMPPGEIIVPLVEAAGDFMDAEENRWWVRPLKVLVYVGMFSIIPLYFYFA